jgi:hypothetical protein
VAAGPRTVNAQDGATLAAFGAVLAAVSSIVVTVFNWLISRDFGRTLGTTVQDMVAPANLAIGQAASGLSETNGLMRTLLDQYGGSLERLTSEQTRCTEMLVRLDERTAKLDELL